MWLDELPREVLERLAAHVTRGAPSREGLNLAHTSKEQRNAVLSVVNMKLTIGEIEHLDEWGSLHLNKMDFQVTWRHRESEPLYRSKSYATVECCELAARIERYRPRFLSIISGRTLLSSLNTSLAMGSVEELSIEIRNGCFHVSAELFFQVIAHAKSLKKLVINGQGRGLFSPLDGFAEDYAEKFAREACPQLEVLHLNGDRRFSYVPRYPMTLFSNLQVLKEVRVTQILSDEDVEILRNIPNVRLSRAAATLRAANLLRERVTELEFWNEEPFDAGDLFGLLECKRLEILAIKRLHREVETQLPAILQTLPELRELRLEWSLGAEAEQDSETPYEERKMATAIPFAILDLVGSTENLSVLHLCNVRISAFELEEITRLLGCRLRDLCTSFLYQDEDPVNRMQIIMIAIAKNNHELRFLRFPDRELVGVLHYKVQTLIIENLRERGVNALWASHSQLMQTAKYLDSTETDYVLLRMTQFFTSISEPNQ